MATQQNRVEGSFERLAMDLGFLLNIIQKQEAEEESFKAVPLHSCLALHPLLHLSHGARVLLEPARLLAVLADHLLVHLLL